MGISECLPRPSIANNWKGNEQGCCMAGVTAKEGGEGAQSRFASALLNLGATYVRFGESKVPSESPWKLFSPAHAMLACNPGANPPALVQPCRLTGVRSNFARVQESIIYFGPSQSGWPFEYVAQQDQDASALVCAESFFQQRTILRTCKDPDLSTFSFPYTDAYRN